MTVDEHGREMEQGEEAIRKGLHPWQGGWRPPAPLELVLGPPVDASKPQPSGGRRG